MLRAVAGSGKYVPTGGGMGASVKERKRIARDQQRAGRDAFGVRERVRRIVSGKRRV